ncbi:MULTISPECIES: cysteine--tRNA ligase [unclassified Thermotoga]|uniref:cysteine--tRNA ligase n=1 Tax=unclassified Thermotoga TaxID=2631113 RepID=UPI0005422F38|nr:MULTISPECIES: cysteine--tRNA ligase [unclassified Thermotoga]KAF2959801.1 cysteinyl-tRNA synthetase [Thermotoga sp. 38H-to]KHC90266.1 cysteinyl-tRNA ligase [Thermotoga sp. Mc24]
MRITNTMTGKKEEFVPIQPGVVRMYVCGPTVYDLIHVGNARPAVVFDVFRRYLEYRGYRVIMVQNFTDIDDKIINKANQLGVDYQTVADTFIAEYWRDAHALGIRPANFHPRTTDFVDDIVEIIERLVEKGFAYQTETGVYFDVRKFEKYGELSKKKIDDLIAGARVEVDETKKFPLDFSLWKKAKPGEPCWKSPWGEGRPGWHIECTVMSVKILGESFDIHAGGEDLVFPHHENEKAQTEALTGKVFARYWMHNGMVRFLGDKMSKSTGNIFTVREAVKKYGRDGLRYMILSKHYRSPMDFSEDLLQDYSRAVRRVWEILGRYEKSGETGIPKRNTIYEEYVSRFVEALDDDFNTPVAVSLIFELARNLSKAMDDNDRENALLYYHLIRREFGPVLGLFDLNEEKKEVSSEELLKLLIEVRDVLRKEKRYDLSDRIRDHLREIGIVLKDTPSGTEYTVK